MACTSDECMDSIDVVRRQTKTNYSVRWFGGTVSNVSHTELGLFIPDGDRGNEVKVMPEAIGELKEADRQLWLTRRFVEKPKMP